MADTVTETLLSEKNPLLKQVRRAVAKGALTEDGYAVAEGFHLLQETLQSGCEIQAVIVSESAKDLAETHAHRFTRTRVVFVSDRMFTDLASTETPQGVIALVKPREWAPADLFACRSNPRRHALALALDRVQDPGNAGAIVRAAEAFGATGVAFLKGSVNPYHPKTLRGSAGSIFRLPVIPAVEEGAFLEALDREQITLYSASPRAEQVIAKADFSSNCAVVIGSEGRGVSERLLSRSIAVRIPTAGVESLNAAVAAGVLLYEARRQRGSR